MQDFMQAAHTCSGNEGAALVQAPACDHLTHRLGSGEAGVAAQILIQTL